MKSIIEEHFKNDEQIENYLNNPLVERMEEEHLIQYEVCIRQDNKTLAFWMKSNDWVLKEFIPSLYKEIEWVSEESISVFNMINSIKHDADNLVVNFDKFNKLFRAYHTTPKEGLTGHDIELDGKISKRKSYEQNEKMEVVTLHSNGKITKAHRIDRSYGYDLIRDDGQSYLIYLPEK